MKLVKKLDGTFEVVSAFGKVLGSFSTEGAARAWIEKYKSVKKYSNDVPKWGGKAAIRILRKNINK